MTRARILCFALFAGLATAGRPAPADACHDDEIGHSDVEDEIDAWLEAFEARMEAIEDELERRIEAIEDELERRLEAWEDPEPPDEPAEPDEPDEPDDRGGAWFDLDLDIEID